MARSGMENELQKALELGQFRLAYQPQILARDGRIAGIEAFIRRQHPERGLLLPDEFIPAAEQAGAGHGRGHGSGHAPGARQPLRQADM
jgi:EAL domain-containing protein (putative c-di-GMP-specific phosphodiesterase class I)